MRRYERRFITLADHTSRIRNKPFGSSGTTSSSRSDRCMTLSQSMTRTGNLPPIIFASCCPTCSSRRGLQVSDFQLTSWYSASSVPDLFVSILIGSPTSKCPWTFQDLTGELQHVVQRLLTSTKRTAFFVTLSRRTSWKLAQVLLEDV